MAFVIALPSSGAGVDAAAILSDGRIVAADAHRRLRVYDAAGRGNLLAELEFPARVGFLLPSPDGRRLITIPSYAGAAGPPVVWDIEYLFESGSSSPRAKSLGQWFTLRRRDRGLRVFHHVGRWPRLLRARASNRTVERSGRCQHDEALLFTSWQLPPEHARLPLDISVPMAASQSRRTQMAVDRS
jgi:hypothetical protein